MVYSLYLITNTLNGKQYVGVTKDFATRMRSHQRTRASVIGRAIKKHGVENFTLEEVCRTTQEHVGLLEQRFIAALDTQVPNGYNIQCGGLAKEPYFSKGRTGRKNSQHQKDVVSRIMKGKPKDYVNGRKGKTWSPEMRAKREETIANREPLKYTDEYKAKRREINRVRFENEEERKRISDTMKRIWAERKAQKQQTLSTQPL